MADVRFTPDQQRAIDTIDKSILVSAAAGSGKTAVLVERIINIIVQGKADVDRMLVVTFTNAAASEMRLKLTKAINKVIKASKNSDPVRAEKLKQQLGKMYRSYISTVHSFCNRVIKEFFYLTDLEPNFKICDSLKAEIMKMEAIEEVFEQGFEEDDFIKGCSFREFLDRYSKERDDKALMQEIVKAYADLRSMPEYFEWSERMAEKLRIPKSGDYRDSDLYKELWEEARKVVDDALREALGLQEYLTGLNLLNTAAKLDSEIGAFQTLADAMKHISDSGESAGEAEEVVARVFQNPVFGTFAGGKGEREEYKSVSADCKARRDAYKNNFQDFFKEYNFADIRTLFEEQSETYKYTMYYLALLKEFERIYNAKKREQGVIDYGDMEHITADILKHKEARDVLRERFEFIFIDEYQDVNTLQEFLIGSVAREDNVFKVGDVKQSIYKFRQAEPHIFEETSRTYKDESNNHAIQINLNKNFRSNGATIDYINYVFQDLMDGYGDDEKLYQGIAGHPDYNLKPEVHLLLTEVDDSTEGESSGTGHTSKGSQIVDIEGSIDNDLEESVEEIKALSKAEIEAIHVADIVSGIIGKEFYDSKSGKIRRATPRDIAILLRSTKNKSDMYYKSLMSKSISSHISDDGGYFDTVEVAVAMTMLKVVDNLHQDIPLISVLRSEVFGFTPEQLAEVRAFAREKQITETKEAEGDVQYRRQSYCDALLEYSANGSDDKLKSRVNAALSTIEKWRAHSKMMQLDDYIWYLLEDSNYYMFAGAMYGGRQRQANLRALVERAGAFRISSIASLSSYISYLEVLRTKNVEMGQPSMVSEEDDVVRIMTIHKSKGLEFPFVIVAGMGNQLSYTSGIKGFQFDNELGIALAYVNPDEHYWRRTLMQKKITDKIREDEYQEQLRVLYVAMTRAREKLYLIGCEKTEDFVLDDIRSRNSYFRIMGKLCDSGRYNEYTTSDMHEVKMPSLPRGANNFLTTDKLPMDIELSPEYEEVKRRLDYEYAYKDELNTKAKYSVSEINNEAKDKEAYKGKIEDRNTRVLKLASADAASIGTAYHRIMEFVDFKKAVNEAGECDRVYIDERAETLRVNNAISEQVFKALDLRKIYAFFETEIGLRACAAARAGLLSKEKPFTLRTEHNGKSVLVQGIIDCYFRDGDELVLLDYKSNRLSYKDREADIERIREEYLEQINLYRSALEEGIGLSVKEAYLYLLDKSITISML
ncbi:UvrD-helicase domain-containing protein [Mogibacterium neglectum]|uniref:UvrD-helicase domain-containing protein n=1 Tax=Mogibacterium neglectum TaxID=114528 RepID=UPI002729ACBD|nr:UvrD-helicase domain-containing protein [Mogibacterium neglectum]WLD76457.1 UvrD-helicase domain-containing protein [Mogibacterium neglectum]